MLPAGYGQADAIRSIETAAVHRGDWRLGGVADGRSGAAARPVAADRRAHVWDESDPAIKIFLSAFMQGLEELDWTDGGNVRMEIRWAGGNVDRLRMFAKELVD